MTHEPKKSDLAEVATKPTNKAGLKTAAESVERRAGTKGNVDQQSTHRTQIRARVSQALGRVRQAAKERKKERRQRPLGVARRCSRLLIHFAPSAGRPQQLEVSHFCASLLSRSR